MAPNSCLYRLSYRWKLWQSRRFTKFLHQLLIAPEKHIETGLEFANVYFTKCNLACDSPKFPPTKKFPSIHASFYEVDSINKSTLIFPRLMHCRLLALSCMNDRQFSFAMHMVLYIVINMESIELYFFVAKFS